MFARIATWGAIAGAIVGAQLIVIALTMRHHDLGDLGPLIGYATMLLALSLVFVAVKGHRDEALGGVIRFLPAFGMGLAVSAVASAVYVASWEATLVITGMDFAGEYAATYIERQRAAGLQGADLDRLIADMEAFKAMYANPFARIGVTLLEIAPVGILVSALSAALLRNPRFLPARRA